MTVTACIVQARVGSTRLPGKVLLDLAGRPVLEHVLRRCALVPGVDALVCAVPAEDDSGPLAEIARALGWEIVAGPEHDVLARYAHAARAVDADVILRVTSDCPLVDAEVCGEVIAERAGAGAEYAANNLVVGYPHGLDCEVFTRAALETAHRYASDAYDREHVGPWMRRHCSQAGVTGPGGDVTAWRWTLDDSQDLEFFRALFALLPPLPALPRWEEVAALVRSRPDLAAINARERAARGSLPAEACSR
jgi:spore coat polysaccharide biosynthesis protein SpsF